MKKICTFLAIAFVISITQTFAQSVTNDQSKCVGSNGYRCGVSVETSPVAAGRNCASIEKNFGLGSQGDDVMVLQNFLIQKGYLNTKATGFFGPKTSLALKVFQKEKGVSATGFVGTKTRSLFKDACSVPPTGIMCTMEARLCPNGTMMPRSTTCEWLPDQCSGSTTSTSTALQACPTQIINNQMPVMCITTPCNPVSTQYAIYQGVRHEVSEFDMAWVKAHCSVPEVSVY